MLNTKLLADDVQMFLKRHAMNQTMLSRITGISQSEISRIIKCESANLKQSTIDALCKVIGERPGRYTDPEDGEQLTLFPAHPAEVTIDYDRIEKAIYTAVMTVLRDIKAEEVE